MYCCTATGLALTSSLEKPSETGLSRWSRPRSRPLTSKSDTARLIMDTCAHGRCGMASSAAAAASQITHTATFPGHRGINASAGRTGELQSRAGTGRAGQRQARAGCFGRWTMTLATLCRLRWQRMLFPGRWESVCAQTARAVVTSSARLLAALPVTKMADITLRWSHDGRLWRCCWSLAE